MVQAGHTTGWVCTVSSLSDGETFDAFVGRLAASRLTLTAGSAGAPPVLEFVTAGRVYRLEFGGEFRVDGTPTPVDYPRSQSIFCSAEREPAAVDISWEGSTLHLDYAAMVRRF